MKRIISGILVAVLLMTIAGSVLASGLQLNPDLPAECKIGASFSFKDGKAQAGAALIIIPSSLTTKLTAKLQKKSGNSWVNVKTASGDSEACASATAESGVTYRCVATCKYYRDGEYIGTLTATTNGKTY